MAADKIEKIQRVRELLGPVSELVPDGVIIEALTWNSTWGAAAYIRLSLAGPKREEPKPNLSWPSGIGPRSSAIELLNKLFGKTEHAPVTVDIAENYLREFARRMTQ